MEDNVEPDVAAHLVELVFGFAEPKLNEVIK